MLLFSHKKYCLLGTEFQFYKMKKVMEIYVAMFSLEALGIYLIPLNCTLKLIND